MPRFSTRSEDELKTCHVDLQRLFREVVKYFDCSVLEGQRAYEEQVENVRRGVSKTMNSKHLHDPSSAVDVVPYPVDWQDTERFRAFGGFVLGVASQLGIRVRWGGDWDLDWYFGDQKFHDLPHFELLD